MTRVFVYFNLHKRVFSIKALEGPSKGIVIAHHDSVQLSDCTFKVSAAGRARVLVERRKNVHAGVVGMWAGESAVERGTRVTYDPYKYGSFVVVDTPTSAVTHASEVNLIAKNGQTVVFAVV